MEAESVREFLDLGRLASSVIMGHAVEMANWFSCIASAIIPQASKRLAANTKRIRPSALSAFFKLANAFRV